MRDRNHDWASTASMIGSPATGRRLHTPLTRPEVGCHRRDRRCRRYSPRSPFLTIRSVARARPQRATPIIAGLTLVAAVLRFWWIGHQSFWYDEAFTVVLVHDSPSKMLGPVEIARALARPPPLPTSPLRQATRTTTNCTDAAVARPRSHPGRARVAASAGLGAQPRSCRSSDQRRRHHASRRSGTGLAPPAPRPTGQRPSAGIVSLGRCRTTGELTGMYRTRNGRLNRTSRPRSRTAATRPVLERGHRSRSGDCSLTPLQQSLLRGGGFDATSSRVASAR